MATILHRRSRRFPVGHGSPPRPKIMPSNSAHSTGFALTVNRLERLPGPPQDGAGCHEPSALEARAGESHGTSPGSCPHRHELWTPHIFSDSPASWPEQLRG